VTRLAQCHLLTEARNIEPTVYSQVLHAYKLDAVLARLETSESGPLAGTTFSGPFGIFSVCLGPSDDLLKPTLPYGATTGGVSMSHSPAEEQSLGVSGPVSLTFEISQTRRHPTIPPECRNGPARPHRGGVRASMSMKDFRC
jgi:hypothetical protein